MIWSSKFSESQPLIYMQYSKSSSLHALKKNHRSTSKLIYYQVQLTHKSQHKADDYENKSQNIKVLRMVLIRSHLFS
jgi:hypothetical protein